MQDLPGLCRKLFHTIPATEVRNAKRLDIVWDIYLPNSFKSATREKRGLGKDEELKAQRKYQLSGVHF